VVPWQERRRLQEAFTAATAVPQPIKKRKAQG